MGIWCTTALGSSSRSNSAKEWLEMLMKHPLTDIGIKKFLDDWNKSGAKI